MSRIVFSAYVHLYVEASWLPFVEVNDTEKILDECSRWLETSLIPERLSISPFTISCHCPKKESENDR